jgi:hypothetical protein
MIKLHKLKIFLGNENFAGDENCCSVDINISNIGKDDK